MSSFQPPPTYAEVVIVDPGGKGRFNPIWLKWFVDLATVLSNSGAAGGTVAHNSTTGKQGGSGTTEFYHLALADYTKYASATLTAHGILLGEGAVVISSTAAMTDGQLLVGQTGADPLPKTVGTDATLAASGALTVAANAVTNAKLAQMAANSLKGNNTGGAANAADLTIAQVLALLGTPTQTKGSWTPADNSGAALTFTGVSANYTQIGNMVFAYATWTYPVTASGANASISGLPVASANANYAQVPSIVDTSASITGGLVCVPIKNTTTAAFDVSTPVGPATNLQLSGATIAVMLAYPAA